MQAGEQYRSLKDADQGKQHFIRYSASENMSQKYAYRDKLLCNQAFQVREQVSFWRRQQFLTSFLLYKSLTSSSLSMLHFDHLLRKCLRSEGHEKGNNFSCQKWDWHMGGWKSVVAEHFSICCSQLGWSQILVWNPSSKVNLFKGTTLKYAWDVSGFYCVSLVFNVHVKISKDPGGASYNTVSRRWENVTV